MKTEKPKRITLQYLLKNDLPVWVRNKTGQPGVSTEPGIIALQVGSGTDVGKLFIPAGNDPVCLTDQVDPTSLKTCRGLFKVISGGGLELLDPDLAEEYYVANESRRTIMQAKIDKYVSHKALKAAAKPLPVGIPEDKSTPANTVKIHPRVSDMCLKSRGKIMSETDMLENLFELESVLSNDDLNHMLTSCSFTGVQKWAREQLDKKTVDPIDG